MFGMRRPRVLFPLLVAAIATLIACSGGSRAMIPTEKPATLQPQSIVDVSGIPKHLPTMAFDEYNGQGSAGTQTMARTYLTYAESGRGNNKSVDDCRGSNACFSVFYFLANFVLTNGACTGVFETGFLKSARESWYMHQPGHTDAAHRLIGHRVLACNGTIASQPVWAVNNANPAVQAYTRSYLRTYADSYDYYLMDETSAHNINQFYGPGAGMCPENPNSMPAPDLCPSTEETPTDPALVQAHEAMFSALTHTNGSAMKLFFNGVTFRGGEPTDLDLIAEGTNVYAGMCEDCVVSHGTFRPSTYPSELNAMAAIDAIPNASFIELNVGNAPAGSALQVQERTITAAMAWLGYSPGHTIVFPNLEYSSKGLAIWPEFNVVPANPIESMHTSYADVQVGARVFRREFAACYNFGTPIGQCAAIVNGQTSGSITVNRAWLRQSYGHVLVLAGGDIASGGKISLTAQTFNPPATSIPAGHAVLLVR